MANTFFHSRSNSLPTQSDHHLMNDVEDQLCRLRAFEATSSSSAASICSDLSSLRHLHEDINNLLQHEQGRDWVNNELLDESLGLVDLCGFARDVLCMKKGSLQELQSSIRINMHGSVTVYEIDTYSASQKKINRKITKYFKSFDKNSSGSEKDINRIVSALKEVERLDFLALKSLLLVIYEENGRSKHKGWSFFSKIMKSNNKVHSEVKNAQYFSLKQLEESEMSINELEEGVQDLFRTLVKTRVCLLNVLTN